MKKFAAIVMVSGIVPALAPAAQGDLPDPVFKYYPDTGQFKLFTDGHYMTAMSVRGPQPLEVFDPPFIPDNGRGAPCGWTHFWEDYGPGNTWMSYWDTMLMSFDEAGYGFPDGYVLAKYPTELTAADFYAPGEWAANNDPQGQGDTGELVVVIVPEPASAALLLLGLPAVMWRRRKK